MSEPTQETPSLEGYYSYYGVPAYLLKQKNGAYASGIFDPAEGVFRAGGSAKKILWDGVRISMADAKRLIGRFSKRSMVRELRADESEWILLPEEASFFLAQSEKNRTEGFELLSTLGPAARKNREKGPEKRDR